MRLSARSPLLFAALLLAGCSSKDPPSAGGAPAGSTSAAVSAPDKPREPLVAPERSGGALMRSADGARLYLADEDHKALRVLPLPFGAVPLDPASAPSAAASASAAPSARAAAEASAPSYVEARAHASASAAVLPAAPPPSSSAPMRPPPPPATQVEAPLPGAPAQVLPVDGFVLATIRDPGLLLVLEEGAGNTLKEKARIPVAADAWGVALGKDEKIAVVTSAWTHTVTGVDWRAQKVLWTVDVAREPRAVVVHPNGKTAYVSHLTSADLTRIDDIATSDAKATKVAFPAAPMRTPLGRPVEGSLGYSLVLDDAGNRLLAARHALGALAWDGWYGVTTIDVLQTANDKPLLAPRVPDKRIKTTPAFDETRRWNRANLDESDYRVRQFTSPELSRQMLVQPRAMIVAHRTRTVWLASEGEDEVGEFPLLAAAPAERPLRTLRVGMHYKDAQIIGNGYGTDDGIASECGAPTGLALSADETLLYVFCRSTYDVATIRIAPKPIEPGGPASDYHSAPEIARVAAEPVDEAVSRGRRLFYGARDGYSSEGMGCAGCHPEGRDDGHVWHEVITMPEKKHGNFLATEMLAWKTKEGRLGHPRQTPMLAGRVNASGPYGWHAQNDGLLTRIAEGFSRHRWWSHAPVDPKHWMTGVRANALVPFLRQGLVPPPRLARELTEQEKRGKQVFESPETLCVQCHSPATEFTAHLAFPMKKRDPLPGFEDEEDVSFKAPSLLFVGGTGPYYHDGSAPTLQALILQNDDRMGKTNQLSPSDKAALVAYLETL